MDKLGDMLAVELGHKAEMVMPHNLIWEIINRLRQLESTVSKLSTVIEATRESICEAQCCNVHNSDCETLLSALKLAKGVL